MTAGTGQKKRSVSGEHQLCQNFIMHSVHRVHIKGLAEVSEIS
jgi:hypothetical protein